MVAPRVDRRAGVHGLLLLAVWLVVAADACAQSVNRAVEFEDLGLTRAGEWSARGAGLAAFVPVAGDVTALVYNPAGLRRIKQRTPVLGLSRDAQEVITTRNAGASGLSSNRTGLLFAGGSVPIPVFRGSLVPAVAVHRMFVSDLDISYELDNPGDARSDAFRLQQSGASYAFAFGFGVELATVLSAGLSFSAFEGGYHALRQSHTRTQNTPAPVDRYVIEDIDGDLDGILGRVGLTLEAHSHAHISVHVTTPTLVNNSTTETIEITEVIENSTGSTVRTTGATTTEYVVPYRIDGGVAIPWGAWLIALQAGTSDWTQAAIDKNRLRLQNGNAALGRTVDLRAGVEWTTPWWPLRLRAGVAQLPFALDYVQADRIDNDRLEQVQTESAPLRFAFGAGVALKRTILIDAAFTHTRGERSATSISETRTWSQVVIEGSYWF